MQKVIQEVSNTSNTYPIFLGDELVFSLKSARNILGNILGCDISGMIESKSIRDGDDLNCLLLMLRELSKRSNDLSYLEKMKKKLLSILNSSEKDPENRNKMNKLFSILENINQFDKSKNLIDILPLFEKNKLELEEMRKYLEQLRDRNDWLEKEL